MQIIVVKLNVHISGFTLKLNVYFQSDFKRKKSQNEVTIFSDVTIEIDNDLYLV